MSEVAAPDQIEQIVGATRDTNRHWARAVTSDEQIYILHSQDCRNAHADLRDCPLSLMLDRGIDVAEWAGYEDRPVRITARNGRLIPTTDGRGL